MQKIAHTKFIPIITITTLQDEDYLSCEDSVSLSSVSDSVEIEEIKPKIQPGPSFSSILVEWLENKVFLSLSPLNYTG